MTYQRATILNEFYSGASGKSAAFRARKLESTLVDYFQTWTELVVYYYRVVYKEDGHFKGTPESQQLPKDIIQPTSQQQSTMQEVVSAPKAYQEEEDNEEKQAALQRALQKLFHIVGSRVTPRVAIEGGQPHTIGRWKEPEIFSSHLSALTWTAQFLIFDYACFHEQDNENQIPVLLSKLWSKFFQQLAETPFGHILQWRLYLFQVGRRQLARHQARWSLDRQTVGYRGVNLHIKHIPQLVISEYQAAYAILHEDLLFEAKSALDLDQDSVPYMLLKAWKLKDDLDVADFGESWVTYPENAELVQKAEGALLRRIQQDAKLRAMLLIEGKDGAIGFNPKHIGLVIPLRQIFLRQRNPKGVISPYLWAELEGKVWPDRTVFKCLTRACARAKIARLHTLKWRHFSAAICKEKFSGKDLATFSNEDITAEDMEDKYDLVTLELQSNHSYATFNMTYAGSTMLTIDTLLHRNHRASMLWHNLIQFEAVLQKKRGRSDSDVLSFRMHDDIKRGQQRRKRVYSEADLVAVTRRVYGAPELRLRVPGQRAAVLAVLGPQKAEQVIIVLATGSGKTLIVILAVSIADTGTTILILPLIALRNDMLRRFSDVGIQPLVWTPDYADCSFGHCLC
ncbi:hypothetical protein GMDG_08157 [Pseudogymnoascus destructans 20631-21]|uniref:DEAD/DEAH-box helicase domain-containing protein n=1 Tax=Pseudogymnoascus destructans (strain ATCC MYA-4855 / 20631-21) TaxID=658429 RepID=L8G4F7_PSED2|nr:hypothetical protein GMDG_08157 [Pseudogymnoascus destructans 20631-21]